MALELVYTSAPSGLKRGTYGFCTVACTRNMPALIASALENLSGYRHLFPAGSPENPVVYSHLSLSLGGLPAHVLSRIADAGLDYTQRTNKLAHHIVLQNGIDTLPPGGPAALFAQPDTFLTHWNQDPTFFPGGKRIPVYSEKPAICQNWKGVTGDPGWGGVLAGAVLLKRPACIIYEPGTDLYPLFRESAALLPYPLNWDATFTTFFTKLPPGAKCLWKGVIAGSAEEAQARAIPNSIFINLAARLHESEIEKWACAEPSMVKLIEAARNGLPQITPAVKTDAGPNSSAPQIQKGIYDSVTHVAATQNAGNPQFNGPKQQIVLKRKTKKNDNVRWTWLFVLMGVLSVLIVVGVGGLIVCKVCPKPTPEEAANNVEETRREEQGRSEVIPPKKDDTGEEDTQGLESNAGYLILDLEKTTKEARDNLSREIENSKITDLIKEIVDVSIVTDTTYEEHQRRMKLYTKCEEKKLSLEESLKKVTDWEYEIKTKLIETEDLYKEQHKQRNVSEDEIARGLQNLKNGQAFKSNQVVLDNANDRITVIRDKLDELQGKMNELEGHIMNLKDGLIEKLVGSISLSRSATETSDEESEWKYWISFSYNDSLTTEQINDVCWGFPGYQVDIKPNLYPLLKVEGYEYIPFVRDKIENKDRNDTDILSYTGGIRKTDESGNNVPMLKIILEQKTIIVMVNKSWPDDEIKNTDFNIIYFSFENRNGKAKISDKIPLSQKWAEKLPLLELDSTDELGDIFSTGILPCLKEKGACAGDVSFAGDVKLVIGGSSAPVEWTEEHKEVQRNDKKQEYNWSSVKKTWNFNLVQELPPNGTEYILNGENNERINLDNYCRQVAENARQSQQQTYNNAIAILNNEKTSIENSLKPNQTGTDQAADQYHVDQFGQGTDQAAEYANAQITRENNKLEKLKSNISKLKETSGKEIKDVDKYKDDLKKKVLKEIRQFNVNLKYENEKYPLIIYQGTKSKK